MGMNQSKKKQKDQAAGRLTLEQANPITQSIIAQLGYPYEIFSFNTSYEEVMDAYEQAVQQGKQEGFTPVLVPADDVLAEYLGILKGDEYSLEAVLASEMKSGEELLKTYIKEYIDDIDGEDELAETEFYDEYDGQEEEIDCYSAFEDFGEYGSNKIKETMLLKVPTTKPWEVVAYVPFGGWNECPAPEEMMAICKYWYEKYGAVPVTISHDIMEMHVPAPIGGEEALQVAKEHFAFCSDRVFQGTETGTLTELAACIAASEIWFFWWD